MIAAAISGFASRRNQSKWSASQINTTTSNPGRKVIGFVSEGSSPYRYCGSELCHDIFVANDLMHGRAEHGFRCATMSVPIDDFPGLCRTIIGREFLGAPKTSIVRPAPASMSRLLMLHKLIGQLAHDTPDILLIPEVLRAFESELVVLMVRCLAEGAGVELTASDLRHAAIMVRFEELLAAHPDRPLYVSEICEAIGVTERTRSTDSEFVGPQLRLWISMRPLTG